MIRSARGGAGLAVLVLLLGIALAAANVLALMSLGHASSGTLAALLHHGSLAPLISDARAIARACPACFALIALSPLALGVVAALLASRRSQPQDVAETTAAAPQPVAADDSALRLLGLLQQEARFVDFLQEDISAYDDAQVGAAVREIHADCRKALAERVAIDRIFADPEGTELEIPAGFDPATVRLTGNVHGEPPFKGTLQHCGWRITSVSLPKSPGNTDPKLLTPAEVEIA